MAKEKNQDQDKGLLPGLSLDKMLGDIGRELGQQAKMGAQELGKALMHDHDAFVLYQRDDKAKDDGPLHGKAEPQKEVEMER